MTTTSPSSADVVCDLIAIISFFMSSMVEFGVSTMLLLYSMRSCSYLLSL